MHLGVVDNEGRTTAGELLAVSPEHEVLETAVDVRPALEPCSCRQCMAISITCRNDYDIKHDKGKRMQNADRKPKSTGPWLRLGPERELDSGSSLCAGIRHTDDGGL